MFSTNKVGILFLFSTKNVGTLPIFVKTGNFYLVSILNISENLEKFAEKVDFYSSISLAGSGSELRVRIRIQPGDLNPDPPGYGSGSATLDGRMRIPVVHIHGVVPDPVLP